jgi:HD-like signal output (HDOD) protein
VNSAFFGLGRKISSPAEAAAYLGADVLKSLILSANVFAQFQPSSIRGFSADALWQHSLHTASAAKVIAKTEHASHALIDESFSAGMLHDTGKLILAANFPRQYGEVLEKMEAAQLSPCDAEREVFGCSHAEIGGYLLGLWGLPVPVVEAIALHHSPTSSPSHAFTALTATCAANALVHGAEATAELEPYLTTLGLNERLPIWKDAVQENAGNGVPAI